MRAKRWQNWTLLTKLVISFTLVYFLATLSTSLIFYYNTTKDVESRTLALTDSTIKQMNTTLELYTQDMERLSLAIFGDPTVQRVLRTTNPATQLDQQRDNNEMTFRLVDLSSPWPMVQGTYLFSTDGRLYYSVKGTSPRLDYEVSAEPWYAYAESGKAPAVFLWPTAPESTVFQGGEQVFSLIRPVNDIPTGRRLAYLKIDLNVKVLKSILVSLDNTFIPLHLLLLSDENRIVYDSYNTLTGQVSSVNRAFDPIINTTSGVTGQTDWEGQPHLYAARKSAYTRWTILALTPYDSVVATSNKTRDLIFSVGLASMLLIALICYLVSFRITRPLRLMQQKMKLVGQGDLQVRLDQKLLSQGEIGQLGRVFNGMLDSLQSLIKEVYEARLREKDARLLALQAQINPHFLFNTLNVMKAMSRNRGITEVGEMAESLADLFRYSMREWSQPVPLRQELLHVENYIKIQQMRFKDRFSYECLVPQEFLDALVVKLSVQPIVENCVVHAMERKKRGGLVSISAYLIDEKNLQLEIRDNGQGIETPTLEAIRATLQDNYNVFEQMPSHSIGIGIINIHRRIGLIYGEEYGISLASTAGEGTVVKITLPYLTKLVSHAQSEEVVKV